MKLLTTLIAGMMLLAACKKSSEFKPVSEDVFSVRVVNTKNISFTTYDIKASLNLTFTSGEVEYGFLFGESENLVLGSSTTYVLGKSKVSIDFQHRITLPELGKTYYVKAFSKSSGITIYSEMVIFKQTSPVIYAADSVLSFGGGLSVFTNIKDITSESQVMLSLDGIPLKISIQQLDVKNIGYCFVSEYPGQFQPGSYTLELNVDGTKIPYKNKVVLLPGKWDTAAGKLSADFGAIGIDGFVVGDWIYVYKVASSTTTTVPEFSKYNYDTGQKVVLSKMDETRMPLDASIIIEGDKVHFLGGDFTGGHKDQIGLQTHYVYDIPADKWNQEAELPVGPRRHGVSALVGNKIYLGMGFDYGNRIVGQSINTYYTDMWSYDLPMKTWTRLADFPGQKGRLLSANFTIGSKIYFTCGTAGITGGTGTATKETWCYDTSTNSWSQKADYPGLGEICFSSFTIGNYGYVGLGEAVTYNSYNGKTADYHFYKYDPVNDKWSETSNFIGMTHLRLSTCMVGANASRGFVFGGYDSSNSVNYNKEIYIMTP